MKNLNLLIAAMTVVVGSNIALAQNKLEVTSVEPAIGIVAEVGAPLLNFTAIPTPNPACQESAVMLLDGKVISSISTGESNRLQRFVEQPDNSIRLVFATKRYTDPGEYTVIVPEGFVTFNDGADINAAYEFTYTVLDNKSVTFEPQGGYYNELPNVIKLTIPGVKEIIDNKTEYNSDTGKGGIPYFLPLSIVFDSEPVIEGNTITWTFAKAPYTSAGEYQLRVSVGALTLIMEDGTKIPNPEYNVYYRKSLIPFPSISLLENTENNEVYEIGDVSVSLDKGCTFGIFMGMPSVYSIDKYGDKESRLFSFSLDTWPVRGENTVTFKNNLSEPFNTPGEYFFIIGKSCFSAVGPYNDKGYFGEGDDDDPSQSDEDIVEVWNNVPLMYRVRVLPSPAELVAPGNNNLSELSEFPIIFPYAKEIEFPFTPAEEAPSIRDRFWREVKGYEVSLEIVNPSVNEAVPTDAFLTSTGEQPCMAVAHINPPLTASKATNYSVYIPKGSFICDALDSRQLIYEVTIDPNLTGVQAPEVAPEEGKALADKFTVVTPQGVVVLKDANASQLFDLPAGLYIINGQATMLR